MADYVSGDGKCGVPTSVATVCALPPGHDGGHRNAYSTAEWPQKCGHVGPFDGMTCLRVKGHTGIHEHPRAGMKMVWSDVTEESTAKQLAGPQRKVRAQAAQITKLEELRRVAVAKQTEYVQLANRLKEIGYNVTAQANLTERENRLRRVAETERDNERERRGRLITNLENDIRRVLGNPTITGPSTWAALRTQVESLIKELAQQQTFRAEVHREHSAVVKRSSDRFYQLAGLLGVATAGETWDTLFQRVAKLKENHYHPGRQAWGQLKGITYSLPFEATTPLATRVDELTKRVDSLYKDLDGTSSAVAMLNERLSRLEGPGQNCLDRYSATGPGRNIVCVLQEGHAGSHVDGTGASW